MGGRSRQYVLGEEECSAENAENTSRRRDDTDRSPTIQLQSVAVPGVRGGLVPPPGPTVLAVRRSLVSIPLRCLLRKRLLRPGEGEMGRHVGGMAETSEGQ